MHDLALLDGLLNPFLTDVLEHGPVQGQISHNPLQPRIFIPELLQLARLARQHAAVRFLPAVERLLGDPDLTADVADGHAARDLLQHGRDLLDGEALLLHGTTWAEGRLCRDTRSQLELRNRISTTGLRDTS